MRSFSNIAICLVAVTLAVAGTSCAGADDPADVMALPGTDVAGDVRAVIDEGRCADAEGCADAPSLVLVHNDSGAAAEDIGDEGQDSDPGAGDPGAADPGGTTAKDAAADSAVPDPGTDTPVAEDAGSDTDPCSDGADVCECRPCLERRPVVLVHGVNGSSDNYAAMIPRLVADGWPEDWIFAFDAKDPSWGCNVDNAADIASLVEHAMAATCTSRVDLVAHSMGTLSSRYFVKNLGGTEVVNTYVTLGGMHHGLSSSCWAPDFLGVCVWQEICKTGPFVAQLNAPPATPGELHWVSIYGTADESIPNDSSHLDGAENIVMDGVTHVGLLEDEATYEEVKRVLGYPCW